MINNQLKNIKKDGSLTSRKKHIKKNQISTGFCQVDGVMSQPSFSKIFTYPDLLFYPNQFNYQVNRVLN